MKVPETMVFTFDDDSWAEMTDVKTHLDYHRAVVTMTFNAWYWVRSERSGGSIGTLLED